MDHFKRKCFLKSEFKRVLLKSIKNSQTISYSRRYQAAYHLTALPRINSRTASVNRCVITGRV